MQNKTLLGADFHRLSSAQEPDVSLVTIAQTSGPVSNTSLNRNKPTCHGLEASILAEQAGTAKAQPIISETIDQPGATADPAPWLRRGG